MAAEIAAAVGGTEAAGAGTAAQVGSQALNVGGNVLSTLLGGWFAKRQQQREMDYNAEQAEINRQWQEQQVENQNAWNLEQWNRENEYNSPQQQMQRLLAAGLSPAAAAQAVTGQPAAQVTSAAPSGGGAASLTGSIAASLGQNVSGIWNDMWQNELLKQKVEGQRTDNEWKPILNDATLRDANATIDEKVARKELAEEQARQIKELLPLLKDKNATEIKDIQEKWKLLTAQIEQVKEQTKNIQQQTENLQEEGKGIKYENEVKKVEAFLAENFGITNDSNIAAMCVQAALSGKGDNIVLAATETALTAVDGAGTAVERIGEHTANLFREGIEQGKQIIAPFSDENIGRFVKEKVGQPLKDEWNRETESLKRGYNKAKRAISDSVDEARQSVQQRVNLGKTRLNHLIDESMNYGRKVKSKAKRYWK